MTASNCSASIISSKFSPAVSSSSKSPCGICCSCPWSPIVTVEFGPQHETDIQKIFSEPITFGPRSPL
ncbi:unnamed protein product [Callosobruchus maculatus]|uniref:Uncharacterized protein n=1 Tax=Callosobruchus maculatus TaxID=64391 RepID=A0A653C1A8_CALMS|nr:unnamed protein product [Callosobruchus maculatus]